MDNKCIEHMYSNLMSKIPLFYLYHPLTSVEHIVRNKIVYLGQIILSIKALFKQTVDD